MEALPVVMPGAAGSGVFCHARAGYR
jgi:hypothetical protein